MLKKKLFRHGNSAALLIDKPILELLGITMATPLAVRTDGRRLIIEPLRRGRKPSPASWSAGLGRIAGIGDGGNPRGGEDHDEIYDED